MNDIPRDIWVWQTEVSPHMAGLAVAITEFGFKVSYVAECLVSDERVNLGWSLPDLGEVQMVIVASSVDVRALVDKMPEDSVHICQGIRGNGLVGEAQCALSRRGLQQWVLMESVDDSGWRGAIKRLEYKRLFYQWRKHLRGVLAIGESTPDWVFSRGMPLSKIFPFAYFLPDRDCLPEKHRVEKAPYRFIYVGQLIERKRVDLLISALATLNEENVVLEVIGKGPLEDSLLRAANSLLPGRVTWAGHLPMSQVISRIALADCLILPSRFDGWGAVVCEALMVGTPVICSDRCGAAEVVRASGNGGVFQSGNQQELSDQLSKALAYGKLTFPEQLALADWAKCLNSDSGARYLKRILNYVNSFGERPLAPWNEECP